MIFFLRKKPSQLRLHVKAHYMLLCDMRAKAVGFYVRSSLHSCETIYFAVLPYMSVYFLVVYCVMTS